MKNITDEDILTAIQMANDYAAFAPGKLFPKQMDSDGDECYEDLVLPCIARLRFLFPQLFAFGSVSHAIIGMSLLVTSADAVRNAEPWSGSIEMANRPEDLRAIHKIRWEAYLSNLKQTLSKILTPFQLNLIEQCFGFEG